MNQPFTTATSLSEPLLLSTLVGSSWLIHIKQQTFIITFNIFLSWYNRGNNCSYQLYGKSIAIKEQEYKWNSFAYLKRPFTAYHPSHILEMQPVFLASFLSFFLNSIWSIIVNCLDQLDLEHYFLQSISICVAFHSFQLES